MVKCVQPPRGIQLTIREQMAVGRVQYTFRPTPTASPSKGNGPGARTDRDAVSDNVVLRQFLRLEPMPLDGDAAPSEPAAAQQHGSGGRARKPLTVRDVDECDVTRVRKAHRRNRRAARTVGQAPTSLASGRLRRTGRFTHRVSVGPTPDSWISTGALEGVHPMAVVGDVAHRVVNDVHNGRAGPTADARGRSKTVRCPRFLWPPREMIPRRTRQTRDIECFGARLVATRDRGYR